MHAKLVESLEIAPGIRHFTFEVPEVDSLDFQPGQFVSLTAELAGKKITRAYSLASAPTAGNRFELCLNEVNNGAFSPHLFAMHPGDAVEMRPPLGTFVWRQDSKDALLIATGTGIAPFRSMLQAYLIEDSPQITLLFGVRNQAQLLYGAEFEDMARRFPQFRFWPTLSQPEGQLDSQPDSQSAWQGRTGRVQAHLDEALGQRRDLDVYLCGMKPMVDDVRQRLKDLGFDRKQIRYEKYD
jgi:CDP-4-dehydro-6-deoxyglucose reductase